MSPAEAKKTDDAIARLDAVRWRAGLMLKKDGTPYGNEANAIHALEYCPGLSGMVVYNEFSDELLLVKSPPWRQVSDPELWTDVDRIELQAYLQRHELPIARPSVIQDAVITVARRNSVNPVVEWLNALEWDGVPRLQDWLIRYMGAQGAPEYLQAIGPRILVAGVARALAPGCKSDVVPVLEGPQGIGKSTAVRILGEPWNADGVPDLSTKDAAIQIQGVWLVELEELTSMTRSDVEHVKAFLSRSVDRYRPPYGRNAINRPRRCIFIATTNLQDYLKDETGNRRFWPIRCRQIDLQALAQDRELLWGEAVSLYRDGFAWHLSGDDEALAEREQELRRLVPEIEADLLDYLDAKRDGGANVVYMRDLLRTVGGISDFTRDRYHAGALGAQFSRILARAGWEKLKSVGRGKDRRQPYQYAGSE